MTSEDQFDLSLFVSPAQCQPSMVRVGVVGYGNLGQYLVENIERLPGLELAWVWNRNKSSLRGRVAEDLILSSLSDCGEKSPDVIVEVAHPDVTRSDNLPVSLSIVMISILESLEPSSCPWPIS